MSSYTNMALPDVSTGDDALLLWRRRICRTSLRKEVVTMAAHFEMAQQFGDRVPALIEAIDGAFSDIGAESIEWSPDQTQATATIAVNLWSWGEKLTVSIDESGEIHVTSTCSFPLQIFDWGKNRSNCRKFLDKVATRLQSLEPTW